MKLTPKRMEIDNAEKNYGNPISPINDVGEPSVIAIKTLRGYCATKFFGEYEGRPLKWLHKY